MARPGRQERNRTARSFRQLRRFHHVINSDKVFGTHSTRSGLDRHRLWQTHNGIWIFAMSGRVEMAVQLIRRMRAYVTGENISLYVLGWDLLDIVPVQRNRRFVAVELNPDAVAVAAATDDDAFPLGSARATRRTARAHSKSGSYVNW